MEKIRLGRTEMMVSRLGFGGVPIQKVADDETAVSIIRRCLDLGITFFDTSAEYSNSEERIGKAIQGRREGLVLATKSNYGTRQLVTNNFKQSLKRLGVNSIDLYQYHAISDLDTYNKAIDPEGPWAVIQEAKREGVIKHIGLTTHSMEVARVAVQSGLFETIMFPFNFVTDEAADELLPLARQNDVGFIAMKPLAAGMLPDITIAIKYLLQFPNVLTIVGVQKEHEMGEIAQIYQGTGQMTEAEQSQMQRLRDELGTVLCRRCGACLPCPEGISILHIMDIQPFLINQPPQMVFADRVADEIAKVIRCNRCGECEKRCPYGLPVMELIQEYSSLYQAERKKYQEGA